MRQPESVRRMILCRWRQRLTARLRQAARRWAGSVWGTVSTGKSSVWGPATLLGIILVGLMFVRPPAAGPLSGWITRRAPTDPAGSAAAVTGGAGAGQPGGSATQALAQKERRARVEELLRGVGAGDPGTVAESVGVAVGSSRPAPVGPNAPLHSPVTAAATQAYGWAHSPDTGDYRLHPGVDFAATVGTVVRAVAVGTVSAIEPNLLYGPTVTVTHSGGWQSRYAGLAGVEIRPGDAVAPGTVLGAVGQPGAAEASVGAHLHLEVRIGDDPVDPLPYLTSTPSSAPPAP